MQNSIDEKMNDIAKQVRPQLEDAQRRLASLNQQATAFIKEHPVACLVGAVGLGYLIARLARRG
jgi:hypothetical protein